MKRGLAHCAAVCNSFWGKTRINTLLHIEKVDYYLFDAAVWQPCFSIGHWPYWNTLELLTHLTEMPKVRSNAKWTNWQNIENIFFPRRIYFNRSIARRSFCSIGWVVLFHLGEPLYCSDNKFMRAFKMEGNNLSRCASSINSPTNISQPTN